MGNFIGILIEERMAIGTVVIRIITQKDAVELIEFLKNEGYGITHIDAQSAQGPVKIIFTIVKRKDIDHVLEIHGGFVSWILKHCLPARGYVGCINTRACSFRIQTNVLLSRKKFPET